ncbi:hypothetical protein B0A50_08487 [Salinomyces thailandicus]|uniref:Uncharacterized protein n=1 Tax=Salinomyces thailandicus TaxID=706561 RepID=A0A4V5N318_9PEZI|nr:hypothetical protein B0A50_08487 [Salinomyces thailandica]
MPEGFRYFKLRNSSGNLIGRMIKDHRGHDTVWENMDNKVQANDSKWTDLRTETGDSIKDKEWYKFGAHVVGPMPNEWDPKAYQVDLHSNKMATFTYTTGGIHLDGLSDRD